MDKTECTFKVESTEKDLYSFFQNEILKERIQELRKSEEYKNLPKLEYDFTIKNAIKSGPKEVQDFLNLHWNRLSFEESLLSSVCCEAISKAFSQYIATEGKIDIIETAKCELTIECVKKVNSEIISEVSKVVGDHCFWKKTLSDWEKAICGTRRKSSRVPKKGSCHN